MSAYPTEPLGEFDLDICVVIREIDERDFNGLPRSGFFRYDTTFWERNWTRARAGECKLLVATVEDLPVGRLGLDLVHPGAPRLWGFDVLQPLRRRGIGSRLMEVAEDLARAHGHLRADIAVEKENRAARRLYERHGYIKIGSERHEERHAQPDGQIITVIEDCDVLRKQLV